MSHHFEHHVFFCLNQREDGKSCCGNLGAEEAFNHMKSRIKQLKLSGKGKVRINRAGCLDRCSVGPLLVIYPEAIWYQFRDNHDIDEIIDSHIQQGRIVERLVV
ncbi:(2Fe-2S) ferredoxin domain-containing protein [Methylobacillus gramineus]|uniref:(2Fe-2S) ferredoxin domain-containing protein n=1 Tax=Methylobacillus gramineus TaxID=755169 RepID=UPI001CFFEB50|nr:(2Fe-2S) ferredoxin domain-containing protein [Methylobacillus gramineus]MCB5185956.1 (2Fe-2S) ferredoxin domain-containing protein [Methylobacillus gramineus]